MTDKITPSQTALFSAAARAAHPLVDDAPHLLDDAIALQLCRTTSPSPLDYQLSQPEAPILAVARLSASIRSRTADDAVTKAGGSQVVVLGGGLDTLSHRVPTSFQGRVWVVDRPGVLAWRSQLFELADLTDDAHLVGADLENGIDLETLTAAGVDLDRPVVVIWHEVSMYIRPVDCRRLFADLADRDEQDVTPAGFWERTDHLHPMRLVRLVQATR